MIYNIVITMSHKGNHNFQFSTLNFQLSSTLNSQLSKTLNSQLSTLNSL